MRCLLLCALTFLFLAVATADESDDDGDDLTPLVKKLCKYLIHLQRRSYFKSRTNYTSGAEVLNAFQYQAQDMTKGSSGKLPEPPSAEDMDSTKSETELASLKYGMTEPNNFNKFDLVEKNTLSENSGLLENTSGYFQMNSLSHEPKINNETNDTTSEFPKFSGSELSDGSSFQTTNNYQSDSSSQPGENTYGNTDLNCCQPSDEAPKAPSNFLSNHENDNNEPHSTESNGCLNSSSKEADDVTSDMPTKTYKVSIFRKHCTPVQCTSVRPQNQTASCPLYSPLCCSCRNNYCNWCRYPAYTYYDCCTPFPRRYGTDLQVCKQQKNKLKQLSSEDDKTNYKKRSESSLTSCCEETDCNPSVKSTPSQICDNMDNNRRQVPEKCQHCDRKCNEIDTVDQGSSCSDSIQCFEPNAVEEDEILKEQHNAPSAECKKNICNVQSSCSDSCISNKCCWKNDPSDNDCKDQCVKNTADLNSCKFQLCDSCNQRSISTSSPEQRICIKICSKSDTTASCKGQKSTNDANICNEKVVDNNCQDTKCDRVSCDRTANDCNVTCNQDSENLSCKPLRICSCPVCIPVKIIKCCKRNDNCDSTKTLKIENQSNCNPPKTSNDDDKNTSKVEKENANKIKIFCIMCNCGSSSITSPDDISDFSELGSILRCGSQVDGCQVANACQFSKHSSRDSEPNQNLCCGATTSSSHCKQSIKKPVCDGSECKIKCNFETSTEVDKDKRSEDVGKLPKTRGSFKPKNVSINKTKCNKDTDDGQITVGNSSEKCVSDSSGKGKTRNSQRQGSKKIPRMKGPSKERSSSTDYVRKEVAFEKPSKKSRVREDQSCALPDTFHDICYECIPYPLPRCAYPRRRYYIRRPMRVPR